MKKQILNLGKALNKAEQKLINGGAPGGGGCCDPANDCCTTIDLVDNEHCGATYSPGCQYHYANPNYPIPPYVTCCI